MKRSDLNHLRRLVAWVQTEIGQSPEELVATVRNIADKLGHPELTADEQRTLVLDHDRARAVPAYVRAAVKALDRYARPPGAAAQPVEPPKWEPQFDAMTPRQEELAFQFCQEIAGRRGEAGRAPDPVRLLEMAQELYEAERSGNLQVLQVEHKPAAGAGP